MKLMTSNYVPLSDLELILIAIVLFWLLIAYPR